jgi:hypothetical protein
MSKLDVNKLEKFVKDEMMNYIVDDQKGNWYKIVKKFAFHRQDDDGNDSPDENFNEDEFIGYHGYITYKFGKNQIFDNYDEPFGSDKKMDFWKNYLQNSIQAQVGQKYIVEIDYDSDLGFQEIIVRIYYK